MNDIFQYTKEDVFYNSFVVSGSQWYLQIYPNGETRNYSVGSVNLYLHQVKDPSPPQGACSNFGLKWTGGPPVGQMGKGVAWGFDGKDAWRTDTLSESFSDLRVSKRRCDSTLKLKQEEFPVHKLILSARSPNFATMIESGLRCTGLESWILLTMNQESSGCSWKYLYSGVAGNLTGKAFELCTGSRQVRRPREL